MGRSETTGVEGLSPIGDDSLLVAKRASNEGCRRLLGSMVRGIDTRRVAIAEGVVYAIQRGCQSMRRT